jgi:amino acid adenylation domain-containing protein
MTCLPTAFEAQSRRTPHALAVIDADTDRSLTFRELSAKANQLARVLQAAGVGPDVLVGLCVERSLDMVIGALGILKAGGAYVPLDPAYPPERLAYMLADSKVAVIVTQEKLRYVIAGTQARILCLDSDGPTIARERTDEPASGVTPDHLAYVVYTSGSTGKPKGVMLEHRGLTNTVDAQIEAFGIGPTSRVLQFASFSFDASVSEIFTSLIAGARLYVASTASLLPGPQFTKLLRDCGITVITLPPSVLAMLPPDQAPGLRTVVSAGEACSAEIVARWAPGRRFLNAYGPSEVTICATIGECRDGTRKPSIGRPMKGCQIYILDAERKPVPAGAEGEIYIGGAGLGRGYLNQPELSAWSFIAHPFATEPGARLYRTGDLARTLPEGDIDFLGRIDDQVKLRGFRIELGEVDAVIRLHPAVQDVAVIVREDVPGDKRLVAYVVPDPDRTLAVGDLRATVKRSLPEHMVPSAFVFIAALPLTPNGKVDRRALPVPGTARPTLAHPFRAPSSELEIQLASIWQDILGIHPIGVSDDFFELGGHSLALIAMAGRIEKLLGMTLSPRQLFGARTITGMVQLLGGSTAPMDPRLVAIQPNGSRQPFFCVHPVTGNALCYADLARHLGPDQPFYGLQTPALEGQREAYISLEDMAADYIAALRSVQPKGPYLLGGWSVGGTIAFEMTRQLANAGERVALLAMIEAWAPSAAMKETAKSINDAVVSFMFAKNLGRCAGKDLAITPALFQGLSREDMLRRTWECVRQIDESHEELTFSRFVVLWEVFKANLAAYAAYELKMAASRPTLFAVTEAAPGHPRPPTLGWDPFTTEPIEHIVIPGNHFTAVYEPHVRVLAEQLRLCLERARSRQA